MSCNWPAEWVQEHEFRYKRKLGKTMALLCDDSVKLPHYYSEVGHVEGETWSRDVCFEYRKPQDNAWDPNPMFGRTKVMLEMQNGMTYGELRSRWSMDVEKAKWHQERTEAEKAAEQALEAESSESCNSFSKPNTFPTSRVFLELNPSCTYEMWLNLSLRTLNMM